MLEESQDAKLKELIDANNDAEFFSYYDKCIKDWEKRNPYRHVRDTKPFTKTGTNQNA